MIQITPMQNQEREKELLTKNQLEKEDKGRVLSMTERDEELGYVTLALRGRRLVIFDFILNQDCDYDNLNMEQEFFIDTLMRSAASYGETNGARSIETFDAKYNKFLKKKGFTINDEYAITPMATIVHYTNE